MRCDKLCRSCRYWRTPRSQAQNEGMQLRLPFRQLERSTVTAPVHSLSRGGALWGARWSACGSARGAALRALGVIAVSTFMAACGNDRVELPRDAAGLEAASLRGDSIARALAAEAAFADTLEMVANGQLDASHLSRLASEIEVPIPMPMEVPAAPSSGTGEGMTRRAQARGDSMARAAARDLVVRMDASGNRASRDTLRGIVVLEGEAPMFRLMLDTPMANTPMANTPVALTGMATGELLRLEGLDVLVRGVRTSPRDLVVASFVVRAKDGVSVLDGILNNANGRWTLSLTEGGERSLLRVPVQLQPYAGTRVYLGEGGAVHGLITRVR